MTTEYIKRTYSLAEVARKLDRPRTTLKDWSDQFREFLPTVGSGRSLRYHEEALEVFGLICKMKDVSEPPEIIRDHLRMVVREIVIQPEEDEDPSKPFLMHMVESHEALSEEVRELKHAISLLTNKLEHVIQGEVRQEIAQVTDKLNERLDGVTAGIQSSAEQIKTQSQLIERQQQDLETIATALSRVESYSKKGFWARLFGK